MPTKRRHRLRGHNSERARDGIHVLVRGIDFLSCPDFTEEELGSLWETYGEEIVEAYTAIDPTLRPGGWWWFSAPKKIRTAWPHHPPLPTEQRQVLVASKLLDPATATAAREKITAFEASGEPMAFFDYKRPRPDPEIEL